MELYSLNVNTSNIGGYFSSEQLSMLSIVQCQTHEEIISFVQQCEQLNGVFSKEDIQSFINQDLEQLKRNVFKKYQDTLVPHNSDRQTILNNTLYHSNIKSEDIELIKKVYTDKNTEFIAYIREYIKRRYPDRYKEIFKHVHRFISIERDQNKMPNLYDELVLLNENLSTFNTLLIGSLKPEVVINEFFSEDQEQFDFYFANNDLEFALKNNKHVRFHSLLTKGAAESLFKGKSKEEILKILTSYVKTTIDFVNEYNSTHRLTDGTPVISAIDLFNEIVSFDKNSQGLYENIWESNYGITIKDLCNVFEYAKTHKPQGVSYLYNEPFLEDSERREKVFEVLQSINSTSDGLIDTLGSQMHITFRTSDEQIQECFRDFKLLQDSQKMNVQITEFDLSLSERETLKTIGDNPEIPYEKVYSMKRDKIDIISTIINSSGIKLNGVSYWSLTDNIDCNLERVRTNLLNKGIISDISQVPTVCGGLIPTSSQYSNLYNNSSHNDDHKKY